MYGGVGRLSPRARHGRTLGVPMTMAYFASDG
jgi:hypothetical protein